MSRKGFALVELLTLGVVVLVLVGVLMLFGAGTRNSGRLGEDLNRLRFHAWATDAYARDHDDRFWSFASQNISDAPGEALGIINRLTGRSLEVDGRGWLPHVIFSHLVLADALGLQIPDARFISSGDEVLLTWASDPEHYDQLGVPAPDFPVVPYSSSFETAPAFWSWPWAGERAISPAPQSQNLWYVPYNAQLGPRSRSEVVYPSVKIHVFPEFAWNHAVPSGAPSGFTYPFFGYPNAQLTLLFADGHVAVGRSSSINGGFLPTVPQVIFPPRTRYVPRAWDPPTVSGEESDIVLMPGRFTSNGLGGRDRGPEVAPVVPPYRAPAWGNLAPPQELSSMP